MESLDGRTVVITGAASGIGRAFAEGFRADGSEVVGCDIDEAGLRALAEQGIHTAVTDVGDDAAVRAVVDLAVERTGRVDVLFNNAGMGNRTAVEDLAPGEFERMIAVHLFGCVYGMRAAIPIMREQGYGRIVNVISRAAESPAGNISAYMPGMQDPADVYPSARVVATLPDDGPTATVFYRGEPYTMFDPANAERMQADRADVLRRGGDA
jgi:NAD(P)-dependent dehydrogenase (short-subunit alcohol dehydrogenase family)